MMMDNTNPWGLTARQVQAMDAYCATGCQKLAARQIGISTRTVEEHCGAAKKKIGNNDGILYILIWDRWRGDRAGICVTARLELPGEDEDDFAGREFHPTVAP